MKYVSLSFKTIAVVIGLLMIGVVVWFPVGLLFICPNRWILKNKIATLGYELLTGAFAAYWTLMTVIGVILDHRNDSLASFGDYATIALFAFLTWSPLISVLTARTQVSERGKWVFWN